MTDTAIAVREKVESSTIVVARELATRLKYMIVNGSKLSDPEVFALAHYAAANRLNPFAQECYYMPGIGPITGIVGYRSKAQDALSEEAARAHINTPQPIWSETRPAEAGEANFDPDRDIAVHVTIHDSITNKTWRTAYFETVRELKELGEKDYFNVAKAFVGPEPVWTGVGVVYGGESFGGNGKPEKFDRYERAAKRAEKVALKKRFPSLQSLDSNNGEGEQYDGNIDIKVIEPEQKGPRRTEEELDRELGFGPTPARDVTRDAEWIEARNNISGQTQPIAPETPQAPAQAGKGTNSGEQPSLNANGDEKTLENAPVEKMTEWPETAVVFIATQFGMPTARARATLNLSDLDFSATQTELLAWVKAYKAQRDLGKSAADAAAAVNK